MEKKETEIEKKRERETTTDGTALEDEEGHKSLATSFRPCMGDSI